MKNLEFKIVIAASKKKVWETMLGHETYKKWASAGWPGSSYEGIWKKGEEIRFGGPGQGGIMATLVECTAYENVLLKHIALINPDGSLDKDSELAKGLIGITESYTFKDQNGGTELIVSISSPPEWEEMFNDGWPNALIALKEICEGKKSVKIN